MLRFATVSSFCFVLLLLQPGASAARRGEWRTARVSINADGALTSLKLFDSGYGQELDTQLEAAMRTWKFAPGKVGGKPAATEAILTVHLSIDELSHPDYADIRVADAVVGADVDSTDVGSSNRQPDYPTPELAAGIEARLRLLLDIDDRGRVSKVALEKSVTNGQRSNMDHFVAAVRRAVPSWHFQPNLVDGRAMPGKVHIPVDFCLEESCVDVPPMVLPPAAGGTHARLLTQVAGLRFRIPIQKRVRAL